MDRESPTAECKCDWPRRAVQNEWFPVAFDEQVGEYQLVLDCGERGAGAAVLRHCPWCGGSLPSKRGTLFTTPSEAEIADVREKMKGVRTAEEMRAVLGEPSEVYESSWRDQFTYEDQWETLGLTVFVYKEKLQYSLHGRYIASHEEDERGESEC